jgi:hypothetical protein
MTLRYRTFHAVRSAPTRPAGSTGAALDCDRPRCRTRRMSSWRRSTSSPVTPNSSGMCVQGVRACELALTPNRRRSPASPWRCPSCLARTSPWTRSGSRPLVLCPRARARAPTRVTDCGVVGHQQGRCSSRPSAALFSRPPPRRCPRPRQRSGTRLRRTCPTWCLLTVSGSLARAGAAPPAEPCRAPDLCDYVMSIAENLVRMWRSTRSKGTPPSLSPFLRTVSCFCHHTERYEVDTEALMSSVNFHRAVKISTQQRCAADRQRRPTALRSSPRGTPRAGCCCRDLRPCSRSRFFSPVRGRGGARWPVSDRPWARGMRRATAQADAEAQLHPAARLSASARAQRRHSAAFGEPALPSRPSCARRARHAFRDRLVPPARLQLTEEQENALVEMLAADANERWCQMAMQSRAMREERCVRAHCAPPLVITIRRATEC